MSNLDSTWETIPLTGNPPPSPEPNTNFFNPPPYVGWVPYTYPANSQLEAKTEKPYVDNNNNNNEAEDDLASREYNYHTFPPPSPTTTTDSDETNHHPCYFETLDFSDYLAAPIDNTNRNISRHNSVRRARQAMREGIAVVCVVLLLAVGLVVAGWAVAGGIQGLSVFSGRVEALKGGRVVAGVGEEMRAGGGGRWGPCTVARPRFCYIVVGGGGQGR